MDPSLDAYLKEKSLQLFPVPKDCNSLYKALTFFDDDGDLRIRLAKSISSNETLYNDVNLSLPLRDMVMYIMNDGQDGNFDVVALASVFLAKDIEVHTYPDLSLHTFKTSTVASGTLRILFYQTEHHYDILIEFPQTFETEQSEDLDEMHSSDKSTTCGYPDLTQNDDHGQIGDPVDAISATNILSPQSGIPDNDNDLPTDMSTEEITNLHDIHGYQRIAADVYRKGKECLVVYMFIPKKFGNVPLPSIFEGDRRFVLHYTVHYSGKHWEIFDDIGIGQEYYVYRCKKIRPVGIMYNDRDVWLHDTLVPHFVMSALRYQFNNIVMECIGKHEHNSGGIAKALIHTWGRNSKTDIEGRTFGDLLHPKIIEIIQGQSNLFCLSCKDTCSLRNEPWHFNLSEFQKAPTTPVKNTHFFTKMKLFSAATSPMTNPAQTLWSTYRKERVNMQTEDRLQEYLNLHTIFNSCCKTETLTTSYLLLLADGPNMRIHGSNLNAIMEDTTTIISLYAGSCREQKPTRRDHFVAGKTSNPNSGVYPLLTNTTKIFMLRERICRTLAEGRLDEAVVIQILLGVLGHARDRSSKLPFLIINQKQSTDNLLQLTNEQIVHVAQYCAGSIPIFSMPNSTSPDRFPHLHFTGNYPLQLLIDIPSVTYRFTTFKDVKAKYDDLRQQNLSPRTYRYK